MLVCVDTNVMLHAFARSSAWAPLFKAIGAGNLRLALSTSIVLEYEEVCAQRGGTAFAGAEASNEGFAPVRCAGP